MSHRVVFINRFFWPDHSATSQLVSDLAFELANDGFDVQVITSRQRYDDARAHLLSHEVVEGVQVRRVWTTRFGRESIIGRACDYGSFYVSAIASVVSVAKPGVTLIAMTDPPLLSSLLLPIARLRGAALVNWIQDIFPEIAERLGVLRSAVFSGLLRRIRNATLRSADVNVAIGAGMANFIRAEVGCDATVVPNWALEEKRDASLTEQSECEAAVALKAKWGLSERFVVGYSGNMGRAHQLECLLDAAALLKDAPEIAFLFIGDGAQRGLLEAKAGNMNLRNVLFLPYQAREQLRISLSVPDIHVVSLDERMEGLVVPSKFVGVIALGKPVLSIGDLQGEVSQLIQSRQCGVALRADDPMAIADVLKRLASDAASLDRMGKMAEALWRAEFQRQSSIRKWKDILSS